MHAEPTHFPVPDDLRERFFGGLAWFERLSPPDSDEAHSAWYLAKGREDQPNSMLLNAALAFVIDHGLESRYRTLFAGIRPADISFERAKADRMTVTFPIWEIASEPVAAMYLEKVLGWKLIEPEPAGRNLSKGDWLFLTPSGRRVFVEVKCLQEGMWMGSSDTFSRPDYRPRIRQALARAYGQLPDSGDATLVVRSRWLTKLPQIESQSRARSSRWLGYLKFTNEMDCTVGQRSIGAR